MTATERATAWNKANRERRNKNNRMLYARNGDAERARSRSRYAANPQKEIARIAACHKRRAATDPTFAMVLRLRNYLCRAVTRSGSIKRGRTMQYVGCTPLELRRHLESTFRPGMTWENRHLWHIDHERPIARFDMSKPEQIAECFHYSNLRCLWRIDNQKKGKSPLYFV